jgi:photosystem II stability/assembly factor-like uncharacterized protein
VLRPVLRKVALSVFGLLFLPFLLPSPLLAASIDPSLLAGMKARSIGPAGMSGRIADIEGVEADPDILYVGSASGGVWKTVDGGDTWAPLFDDQPVASIGALAVFQANPDVVWVGTGEGNIRNSVSVGNGIYRSLDAGKTWTHLGLEDTERIHRIVLHPTDPNIAWVAALGKAWGDSPERGVYKTVDGGKTWKLMLSVDAQTGATDLVVDPRNPNKLLASMWSFRRWPWSFRSGGSGSGLRISWDGGDTWKKLTPEDGLPAGDLGRIGLAMSRSNPDVVYAMTEAKQSALLRSEDGGRTWKSVNDRYDVDPRPFYFGDVRVDPELPNRVYSLANDVRVSDDGGRTFTKLIDGSVIHGDFHALWIDPRHPDHLVVGGDGGLGISHNRGQSARFVPNLPLGQFYHVAVDMQQPYNVYGGLQDNGSWRGPSTVWQGSGIRNHEWISVGTGDGFETLPDLGDARYIYSLWQGGNLGRYEVPTGQTREIKPSPPPTSPATKLRFNWNAGLAADPFHPGTLYLGSQFLHKTADRGETWTLISPDLTSNNPEWQKQNESGGLTPDVTGAEGFTTIITIAPSTVQEGVIWVGTDDGRVQVTRDGGKSWDSVEKNVKGVPANTWVPAICPSKHDPASAFAVFDNHRRSDMETYVYRTDDWGKSWKRLAGAVPASVRGYALSIEQDPVDRDLLFLGTEFGLWVSLDGGGHWMPWRHGVPTVAVMDLAIHPREQDLVIATHGRSLFILDDIRPLRTLSEKVLAEPVHLFEIADAQQHAVRPDNGGFALGFTEYRGENRPYGALLTYSLNQPGLPLSDAEKERERKEKERAAERQKTETQAREGEEKPAAATETKENEPKEDAKEDKNAPKAEIRITDAAGKLVRHFKQPATLGVNRSAWDLRRDDGKQFPSETPQTDIPAGPEVAPGTYTVTVKLGDHESKAAVRVLGDPRSTNTAADWQAREAAITRLGQLQDTLAEAVDRIRRTRTDVDVVLVKVKKAQETEKAAHPEQTIPAEPPPLVKAGEALQKKLTALERRLWTPYDTRGITPETDALTHLSYVRAYVTGNWAPPSPTHLEYLGQAEKEITDVLADFNRLYAGDVADFRRQVETAKVGLLPEMERLEVKRP